MKIVTTPMCEKILEFAGISDYKVNKNPDEEEGDLAILLSESKIKMNSLSIKLNTFSQIKNSIIDVSKLNKKINKEENKGKYSKGKIREINKKINKEIPDFNENLLNGDLIFEKIEDIFSKYPLANEWNQEDLKKEFQRINSNIKIKVYSNFLKDIVEDMEFVIVESDMGSNGEFDTESNFDYIVFPDYMEMNNLKNNMDENICIAIPTHSNVPKDPIKRAEMRYSILSNLNKD